MGTLDLSNNDGCRRNLPDVLMVFWRTSQQTGWVKAIGTATASDNGFTQVFGPLLLRNMLNLAMQQTSAVSGKQTTAGRGVDGATQRRSG